MDSSYRVEALGWMGWDGDNEWDGQSASLDVGVTVDMGGMWRWCQSVCGR